MEKKNLLKWMLITLFFGIIFVGCNKQHSDLTDTETTKYEEQAKEVITAFNEKDSEKIKAMCDSTMVALFTDARLEEVYQQIGEMGKFEEFVDYEATKASQDGKNFVVIVQRAKYEKGDLNYTISFDEDDKLAGIYYK